MHQRPASYQHNAAVHDVSHHLWWSRLQDFFNSINQSIDRDRNCLTDVGVSDNNLSRKSGYQVTSAHRRLAGRSRIVDRTDANLDVFRCPLAQENLELVAGVADDSFLLLVSRDVEVFSTPRAAGGDLVVSCRPPANIYNHHADGVVDRHADADGRGNRLFNNVHFARAGADTRVLYRAALPVRDARGGSHYNARG